MYYFVAQQVRSFILTDKDVSMLSYSSRLWTDMPYPYCMVRV